MLWLMLPRRLDHRRALPSTASGPTTHPLHPPRSFTNKLRQTEYNSFAFAWSSSIRATRIFTLCRAAVGLYLLTYAVWNWTYFSQHGSRLRQTLSYLTNWVLFCSGMAFAVSAAIGVGLWWGHGVPDTVPETPRSLDAPQGTANVAWSTGTPLGCMGRWAMWVRGATRVRRFALYLDHLVTSLGFPVTIMFWGTLFDYGKHYEPTGLYTSAQSHVVLGFLFINWMMSRTPGMPGYWWVDLVFGGVYLLVNFLYFNAFNKSLYKVLDWTTPGKALGVGAGVFVLAIAAHFMVAAIAMWRNRRGELKRGHGHSLLPPHDDFGGVSPRTPLV